MFVRLCFLCEYLSGILSGFKELFEHIQETSAVNLNNVERTNNELLSPSMQEKKY